MDPYTGDVLFEIPQASREDLDEAYALRHAEGHWGHVFQRLFHEFLDNGHGDAGASLFLAQVFRLIKPDVGADDEIGGETHEPCIF